MPLIDNNVHANGGGAAANVTNNITVHVHVYPATEPVLRKLWRALHGTGRHRSLKIDDAAVSLQRAIAELTPAVNKGTQE